MDRRSAWVAAFLIAASPALTAQQGDPGQAPAFRTAVELVSVDVGVVDRDGRPVRGLQTADFTVTVAGQARRVVSAEFIEAASMRAAPRPDVVPVSTNEGGGTGRQVVFIVDQATLEAGSIRQVARAAATFLDRLSFADRSGLILLPVGPNVSMTWAHGRVRDALQRVTGQAGAAGEWEWEYGSLAEARDIANRNPVALRTLAERECRTSIFTSAGGAGGGGQSSFGGSTGGDQGQPSAPGGGGSSPEGGTGGTGQPGGGGNSEPRPGGTAPRGANTSFGSMSADACVRDIQLEADRVWRGAQMTSLGSLSALQQALEVLGRMPGDKTIILLSGGWPLDDREQTSALQTVAGAAASARASVFTLYLPANRNAASRRTLTPSPRLDEQVESWPLETLSGMTGGASFRVDIGAEQVFERLGQELGGYYRLGVERSAVDLDGRSRRLKVQVGKRGSVVRARELFDVRTYEDRDWTARMSAALHAPLPATGVGLRVTSYVAANDDAEGGVKLMLAGEATRMRPGQATFQLVVRDLEGKELLLGEQPLGEAIEDRMPFAANLPLTPGEYVVRLAVMDSGGRVGSVDHRVDARLLPLGDLAAAGPLLVRMPSRPESAPRLALDGVPQDERLALQVDLTGDRDRLAATSVRFEIAASADGPSLVTSEGALAAGGNDRTAFVQGLADVRVLPPGEYVARATVSAGTEHVGTIRRTFAVLEARRLVTEEAAVVAPSAPTSRRSTRSAVTTRAARSAPPFALEQVLAPTALGAFLDGASARAVAASPSARAVLDRARAEGIRGLELPASLASEAPAAASFFEGLQLLAQQKPRPAADAFRRALRAAPDFYPAMVYLGACFAAAGQDKEAAGAWRTALIKHGDARALHALLVDALLRQGEGGPAIEAVERARLRWPDDDELKRRFVAAALTVGKGGEAFSILDELVQRQADDEPTLALALHVLYEAFTKNRPVAGVELDRARMTRYAEVYRTRGGPSLALVDTWVAAAARKR